MLHVFYTFNGSETEDLISVGFILTIAVLNLQFAKCVSEVQRRCLIFF